MKVLVIGLGSMGKRRIRCLKTLGFSEIYGFDTRLDRNEEVKAQNVIIVPDAEEFLKANNVICIISTPPDRHKMYIDLCSKYSKKFFVEASVISSDLSSSLELNPGLNKLGVPSCTLYFHPAIRLINEIIKEGKLGKPSHLTYHSGQYLPDWHPYEPVSDYYVSNPITGAAREIVPFELSWICKIFGIPEKVKGFHLKTIEIEGAEKIDDTYTSVMSFKDSFLMSLTVEVVSRKAIRTFVLNGSKAQLRWNWENDFVDVFYSEDQNERLTFAKDKSHEGYNSNIVESMYVEEVKAFIDFTQGKSNYPSDLKFDLEVLRVLDKIEMP